jgi:hypothetical protein
MAAYIPPFPALFVSVPPIPGTKHKELPLQASLLVATYADNEISRFSSFKDIVQPKKEVGQEGYQSIRLDLVHNRRYFLGTLKGLIFCFKF